MNDVNDSHVKIQNFEEMTKPFGEEEEEETKSANEKEEEGGKARKPSCVKASDKPAEAEVREHVLAHLPFRSWCPYCVGKARTSKHVRFSKSV